MQPFSFSSEHLWSAWIPAPPLPNPHGVFRCRPLPVAATLFQKLLVNLAVSVFFLRLHQRWAHLLLPLVEYDSRCFHLKRFFFWVQPQHHCALNPVIFICLDSDTTADAKYIAQIDTLTILAFFITLMWEKKNFIQFTFQAAVSLFLVLQHPQLLFIPSSSKNVPVFGS